MDDYNLKCRICLDDNGKLNMFELFNNKNNTKPEDGLKQRDGDMELYEKVEYCCRVKIRKSNELPAKICSNCHKIVHVWLQFRQMCLTTQVYLESVCKETQLQTVSILDDEIDKDYLRELYKHLDMSSMTLSSKLYSGDSDENDDTSYIWDNISAVVDESNVNQAEIKGEVKNKEQKHAESCDMQKNQVEPNKTKRRKICTKAKQKSRTRSPSPSSFMCNICGNVYTKKTAFTYHMSKHNNLRPHECEICGKKFRQVCELKNHIRRHTGEKPYKCKYCERCFIDRSEKHRHERVHTNTRPYVCKICNKSFMYSAILKNHSKLHSGEKSYNCLVCEKSFTLQHHLKAHLQTLSHKQKEEQYVSAGFEVVYE